MKQLSFGGSFQKGETITGSTSGATSTVLAEDIANNLDYLFQQTMLGLQEKLLLVLHQVQQQSC